MASAYIADLRRAASTPRLEKYRPVGGSDLDTAVNYFWNIALAEAFYPGLAALEVVLRNAVHDALTAAYNTELWFYTPGLLEPRQLREFAQARLSLYHQHGNTPAVGLIVAQLNFGFWTTLLSRTYHASLWNPNRAANLRAAFPQVPRPQFRRELIHRRYNDLRFLRNRVMHHEPIWSRPNLLQDHRDMVAAIGWINPAMRDSISRLSRFPDIYERGRKQIEADLRNQIGIP